MKVFTALEPSQKRNLLILFIVGILFWASFGTLLPTLPSYIKNVGANDQEVGLVMGAYALGALLFRPKLGRLADRRSRKLVLILGTLFAAIAPIAFLLVKSIPLLMASKAFQAISVTAFSCGYNALVVDLSPILQRGELIGYMSLVAPIGVAIGPALGGFLQESAGYMPLFVTTAGIGIFSLLCVSLIKEIKVINSPQIVEIESTTHKKSLNLLARPDILIPTIILFLVGTGFGVLAIFVPLFIKQTHLPMNVGWFYTASAMASFIARFFTGRASDRYGRGLFITANLLLFALSMLILVQAKSTNAILLAGILEGAGSGTVVPMINTLVSDRSHPHERGEVFGLCMSGFDLGMAIAGPVFGAITHIIGYQGIFALSAGFAFLALILFVTKCSKNLSESLLFASGRGRDAYAISN